MRVLIQRVREASVTIDGQLFSEIGYGYLLLVGFEESDNEEILVEMARKVLELRICEDENGKMNLSVCDIQGDLLSVSQFTLYADARKGRRPSFTSAAPADQATALYDRFNELLKQSGLKVRTGVFQADMKVQLINDGPVTIMLDSKEVCRHG